MVFCQFLIRFSILKDQSVSGKWFALKVFYFQRFNRNWNVF